MTKAMAAAAALFVLATFTPAATASHPTQICLDVRPDRSYPASNDGDEEELEAAIGATDDDHEEPHQEGCVIGDGGDQTQVDFEVTGAGDPDGSDSPESPDMTCTTRDGTAFCHVIPPPSSFGEQRIAAWIDFDQDDSTVDLDREEEPDDEDTDSTDVVAWSWTHYDYFLGISIKYERDRGRFVGSVNSEPECSVMDREVTVKRKVGDRNVSIGSA